MDKYIFETMNEQVSRSQLVAKNFNLMPCVVEQAITQRNQIGSVQIADDIELPHVVLPNLSCQGILLLRGQRNLQLIMVIDEQYPSENIITVLDFFLSGIGLKKLRTIRNQQELTHMIKEVLKHA
ncbi:hypothetical protein AB3K25_03380 [Leuconostoc sp. MS02]|uniref:PTS EIIA type-2 domain-containing protein n=1 Tax=Leuconostoc aquikimchii TaxID=3236804 RepID=A0ABV3S3L4_9LACO